MSARIPSKDVAVAPRRWPWRWRLPAGAGIAMFFYVGWVQWSGFLALAPLPVAEPASSPSGAEGRDSASGDVASAAEPPVATAESTPLLEPLLTRTPATELAIEGRTRSPQARSQARSEATPLLDASPPASEPDGARDKLRSELTLGGSVLDRDGNGVPGLPIQALPRRLFAALDDGTGTLPMPEQRATTDAAGHFSFDRLLDGEYELRIDETELYEKATAVVRAGVDSAVLVVATKTERVLSVHGVVESTRGGPLKGVRVEVAGQPRLAAISDGAGAYGLRLPVSTRLQNAALRFIRNGYREQRLSVGADEALEANEVVRDVRLEPVGVLAAVSGRVTGNDGPPVSRASVQLYSAGRGRRYQTVSDAAGQFVLDGVEESDDYRVWVHAEGGYRDRVQEGMAVDGQATTLDVVLESMGTASLRGSMVDPEGRPLPGFTLWLRSAYGGSRSLALTSDSQGRFAVGQLPEGPVALETRAIPQITVAGISLAAGPPREVVLALDVGPHALEGYVLRGSGTPVGGARVSLRWARDDGGLNSRSFRETLSDTRGYFLFTQLGLGPHTLSVTAAGFRSVRLEQPVASGAPPMEIKLAASP